MAGRIKCVFCLKKFYSNMLVSSQPDSAQCLKCSNIALTKSLLYIQSENSALKLEINNIHQRINLSQSPAHMPSAPPLPLHHHTPVNPTSSPHMPSAPPLSLAPSPYHAPVLPLTQRYPSPTTPTRPITPLPLPSLHVTPRSTPTIIPDFPPLPRSSPSPRLVLPTPPRHIARPSPHPVAEQWTKVTNPSTRKRVTKTPTVTPTTTRNSFHVLHDQVVNTEEVDIRSCHEHSTNVLGDSLVRSMGSALNPFNKGVSRRVNVYPGARIDDIIAKVAKIPADNKEQCLIACVGSNDSYRKGLVSDDIMSKYKQLLKELRTKSKHVLIVGIAPRFYASTTMLSKIININTKLEELSKEHNVDFIDPWSTLCGNRSMYRRDGVHFSRQGSQAVANLINKAIYIHHEHLNC